MKFEKVIYILMLITVASCSSPDVYKPPIPNYWGYVNGNFNGSTWAPTPFATQTARNDTLLTIIMDKRNINNELRETFSISNIPKINGTYPITIGNSESTHEIGASFWTVLEDGDVGGDYFPYDSTLGYSYIQVIDWDDSTKEIKGFFDVRLLRFSGFNSSPEYPDTLLIHGDFLTKFNN